MISPERLNNVLLKIAFKMRTLRRNSGQTQREVTKATGQNIGNIEAGKMNINISTCYLLCKYYGLTLEEFFDDIDL